MSDKNTLTEQVLKDINLYNRIVVGEKVERTYIYPITNDRWFGLGGYYLTGPFRAWLLSSQLRNSRLNIFHHVFTVKVDYTNQTLVVVVKPAM